jgi:outer membrane receptor for ferric coprogen and ferric-rhodotorulic acid
MAATPSTAAFASANGDAEVLTFSPQLSAQLNLGNVLDERYASRNTGWWGGPYTYGEPRNWRATFVYGFE